MNVNSDQFVLTAKKYWWVLAFYLCVVVAIVLTRSLEEDDKLFDQDVLILVGLVLLPFLLRRLTEFEAAGVKVKLTALEQAVDRAKEVVSKEVEGVQESYQQLSAKLGELARASEEYLAPQDLWKSEEVVSRMRSGISNSPLTREEIENGLASFNPMLRIPAYLELAARPNTDFVDQLIDCYWLEQWLARRRKETRPLWQLLVCSQLLFRQVSEPQRQRAILTLQQLIESLVSDDSIDPEKQCEKRANEILASLTQGNEPPGFLGELETQG